MKKLFLSLVAFIVTATAMYAQNSLVATLSHGDDITMYYGTNALRDAVNAAESGDIINLSGGSFQAVDITKAVTIRGAGINNTTPTYINGNFTIDVASDDTNSLSMEGVWCTNIVEMQGSFNNPYFIKSMFHNIQYKSSTIKNAMFINCKIPFSFYLNGSSTAQFINSLVVEYRNLTETAAASFLNCVILPYGLGQGSDYLTNTQLLNCIIYQTTSTNSINKQLPSSTVATNCVSIGYSNLFGVQVANVNNKNATFTEVFKDFTGKFNFSQTFELTDDAKTNYLGSDGTEVGMYGGVLPYTPMPSYPQITKMNVASKTTADGKLSVEIEVSAVE